MIWVLIFAVATSTYSQAGTGVGVQEFNTKSSCLAAAEFIAKDVNNRGNEVVTLVCVPKGAN